MTLFSDMSKLQEDVGRLATRLDETARLANQHDEQISGERGLSSAIAGLTDEIKGLRKAAWWVAGVIVAGSITFAFSVLTLVS